MSGLNTWIKSNVATILTVGGLLITLIGQWNYFSAAAAQTWKNDIVIQQHIFDSQRHIDPVRDQRQIDQLIDRINKLEGKIDKVIEQTR